MAGELRSEPQHRMLLCSEHKGDAHPAVSGMTAGFTVESTAPFMGCYRDIEQLKTKLKQHK
jgi:hypothetical protein